MTDTIIFTPEAHAALEAELQEKKQLEKELIGRLQTAREMGDLSENGAYKYAKFELGNTRRRMGEIRHLLSQAVVQKPPQNPTQVVFGCTVTVQDLLNQKQHTYQVVDRYEADPLNNKISTSSPIGLALFGKKLNDTTSFTSPQGERKLLIVAIT